MIHILQTEPAEECWWRGRVVPEQFGDMAGVLYHHMSDPNGAHDADDLLEFPDGSVVTISDWCGN